MITGDHVGAVLAFGRSLELEPSNTKVKVYLGQASTSKRERGCLCSTPRIKQYVSREL